MRARITLMVVVLLSAALNGAPAIAREELSFTEAWTKGSLVLALRYRYENVASIGKLKPYAYWLDFDNQPQHRLSSASYGLEFVGKHQLSDSVALHFEAAHAHSPAMGTKYEAKVAELMSQPEHTWTEGLSAEEAEALRKMYAERYNE